MFLHRGDAPLRAVLADLPLDSRDREFVIRDLRVEAVPIDLVDQRFVHPTCGIDRLEWISVRANPQSRNRALLGVDFHLERADVGSNR